MSLETAISTLTTASTALTTEVATSKTNLDTATTALNTATTTFQATTTKVDALNLVDNTSDVDKPISTAGAAANTQLQTNIDQGLATKQDTLVSGSTIVTLNGESLLGSGDIIIARSATSLSSQTYDNRGQLRLESPVIDDSVVVEGIGMFQWVDTQEEPDEDITCFSTYTVGHVGQWLLAIPAVDYIDATLLLNKSLLARHATEEPARFAAYLLANT